MSEPSHRIADPGATARSGPPFPMQCRLSAQTLLACLQVATLLGIAFATKAQDGTRSEATTAGAGPERQFVRRERLVPPARPGGKSARPTGSLIRKTRDASAAPRRGGLPPAESLQDLGDSYLFKDGTEIKLLRSRSEVALVAERETDLATGAQALLDAGSPPLERVTGSKTGAGTWTSCAQNRRGCA